MIKKHDVIVVSGLVKKFGKFNALDGLDLSVAKGEVHGLLGPNGAGKSTTIRILLGLLDKTAGFATVLGGNPKKDAVVLHRRLAYVPGEVNLWPNLSGGESIDLLGALRGGLDKRRLADLLERFQLDPRKKFRTYSKGNRQKVALIAALASDVELYILDEPTSGLDPLMEAIFQDYIKDLKASGKTVLLSSHILAEVEALCDRVTIIREGKTVQTGTLDELRHLHRTTIKARLGRPATKSILKNIHNLHLDDGGQSVQFEVASEHIDAALETLTKYNVRDLTSQPPSLEELFLSQYNKDKK